MKNARKNAAFYTNIASTVIDLNAQGLIPEEIATKTGINSITVRKILKKAGVYNPLQNKKNGALKRWTNQGKRPYDTMPKYEKDFWAERLKHEGLKNIIRTNSMVSYDTLKRICEEYGIDLTNPLYEKVARHKRYSDMTRAAVWALYKLDDKMPHTEIEKKTDMYSNEVGKLINKCKKDDDYRIYIEDVIKRGMVAVTERNALKRAAQDKASYSEMKTEHAKVTPKFRDELLERDNHTCQICGATTELEVDHIIPVVYHGKTTKENTQILCASCNSKKGIKMPD